MFEALLQSYGYWALVLGTFLEGETVLVLGGFAAHRGYLALPGVIGAAFVGTLAGDQLYFFLGRRHGSRFLARRPAWQPRLERAERLLEGHATALILGFRFVYGLRTVVPFAIGMSRFPARRFLLLNVAAAAAWASVVGVAGYVLGDAVELVLGDVERYELRVFAAIVAVGSIAWTLHFLRRERRRRLSGGSGARP